MHQVTHKFLRRPQIKNTSRQHKRQLLQHSDGSGKIVPQLRETALWLAGVDEQFFDLLMDVDPEMLVRADFAKGSEVRKEGLLRRLLACFDDGTITPDRDLRWLWGRVGTAGVEQIVEPYLEKRHSEDARRAAIVIARECKATGLGPHIARIALDPTENDNLRSEAAAAVYHIGENNSRLALKPLIFGDVGSDPEDTLKGYALRCNWPDNMSATELFTALTPQKKPHFMGSYKAFLESEVTAGLRPHDSPKSIEWAGNYAGGRDPFDVLGKLAGRVLGFWAHMLEVPGVVDLLAPTLFKQWKLHFELDSVRGVIVMAGNEARRRLARALLPISVQDEYRLLATIEICSLGDHDLEWLLNEFLREDNAALKQYLADLIGRLLTSRDVQAWDATLAASNEDEVLRSAIRGSVGPVLLDSEDASRWREWEALRSASVQDQPQPQAEIEDPLTVVRRIFLCTCPSSFYQLFHYFAGSGFSWAPSPIVDLWETLDGQLKQGTLAAASAYLLTRPIVGGPLWWRERTMTWNILAGYAALYILALRTPEVLQGLTSGDWDFWTRVILAEQMGPGDDASRDDGARNVLLSNAYEHSKAVFLATLSDLVEADDERFQTTSALDSLGSFWNDDIGELVVQFLRRPLRPKTFQALLASALRRGVSDAAALAENLAGGPVTHGGPDREKAIIAAIELASYEPSRWPSLWGVLRADQQLGMDLLNYVASQDYFNLGFAANLDDESLADLYLWIAERVDLEQDWFAESNSYTDDQRVARWSNTIMGYLARRGTLESCYAIRRIVAALPQYGGLRGTLKEAEERTRRAHWVPFAPAMVVEIASNPKTRLVRNGVELLELIEESLQRLEVELQGATPTAETLWDGNPRELNDQYWREAQSKGAPKPPRLFRPKKEGSLSDSVKKHLERDLRDSGIVLNREVQIRPPLGAKQGETTDIYVDVMVPTIQAGVKERLSAVVEVKGCWNRDVKTDMETQLANRYMNESGIYCGLYLVGWYECMLWDHNDYKWGDRLKLSLAEARTFFAQQAQHLTKDHRQLRSFVLDVRLR